MEKAASDGQKGMALTDHGLLSRPITFIRLCREKGMVPVLGFEAYFVPSAREQIRNFNNSRRHLVLLAKNKEGLNNMIALLNKSWKHNCFMGRRGLLDWKLLKKYSSGIICLTACFWNIVSRSARLYGEDRAEENFRELYDIFGSDFYPELGRHGIKEEEISNRLLIKFSKKYAVKPVVTNDVHYLNKEDSVLHDCFIKSRFSRISSFSYSGSGYHLKTVKEMAALGFKREYLENSMDILDKCSVDEDSFIKGKKPVSSDIYAAFKEGSAAFVPEIVKVSRERARQICLQLGESSKTAEKLFKQWRQVKAFTGSVAINRDPPLEKITPLFKWKNLPVCQFPREELKKQNIFLKDV